MIETESQIQALRNQKEPVRQFVSSEIIPLTSGLIICLDGYTRNGHMLDTPQSLVAVVQLSGNWVIVHGSTTDKKLAPIALALLCLTGKPIQAELGTTDETGLQPPQIDPNFNLSVPVKFCFAYTFAFTQQPLHKHYQINST